MNFFKNLTKIFKSINSKNLEKAGPNNLDISPNLIDFAENELLPGLNISSEYFWKTFENILEKFQSLLDQGGVSELRYLEELNRENETKATTIITRID